MTYESMHPELIPLNIVRGMGDVKNREHGSSNLHYSPSNGTIKSITECDAEIVKSFVVDGVCKCPHGVCDQLEVMVGIENGKLPSSRKFVADDSDEPLDVGFDRKKRRRHPCSMLSAFLSFVLLVFVALYVFELTKEKKLWKTFIHIGTEKPEEGRQPCFERVRAEPLSAADEADIFSTAQQAGIDVFTVYKAMNYHAISIHVSYMAKTLWSFSYGRMNHTDAASHPPTSSTRYPIASVTKVFTVLMLEKLVEHGRIRSKDDSVYDYDNRFYIRNPFNEEPITFRQLACMMGGLPRESPCHPVTDTSFCPYTSEEMFRRIRNMSLILPPNEAPSYSNLALAILGHVMETIVGGNETVESWITSNILQPLGMENTGFVQSSHKDYPVSSNFGSSEAKVIDWGWLRPGGGMYSTVEDLGKLGSYILGLSNSTLIKKGPSKEFLRPEYIYPDGSGQGCPFEVIAIDPYADRRSGIAYFDFARDGSIFGYGSVFGIIPDLKMNINVLTAGPHAAAHQVYRVVRSNFVKAIDQALRKRQGQYVLPASPESYVGTYVLTTYWPLIQKSINVTLENATLYINIEWLKAPLSYVSNWTLETRDFGKLQNNQYCSMRGYGLLRERYFFTPPDSRNQKCPGFHVNGIAAYGYAEFKRIS